MAEHNDLGRWGEALAARHLEEEGWFIRHRDWHCGHLDLDLVAIDEDAFTLLVVEVKTRSSAQWGAPDDAIDLNKKNNLLKATRAYQRTYHMEDYTVRFDTISVTGVPLAPDDVVVEHKENAFDALSAYQFHEQERKRNYYRNKPGQW